jgi:hypothetical protein
MAKFSEFSDLFDSSKGKTAMNVLLVVLVLAILAVSIYLVIKRSSEHYAPQPGCLEALQNYKSYKCSPGGSALSGFAEVDFLDQVQKKCGGKQPLGDYVCDSDPSTMIQGGIQTKNRSPKFFPNQNWNNSVKGTDPTIWGLYSYTGQK